MNASVRLRVLPALIPVDGRQIELQATPTFIQWRYATDHNGEYPWVDLIPLADLIGPEGPAIELRSDGTSIQYRVMGGGDDSWVDVIPLSDIQGEPGPAGPEGPSVADGNKGDVTVGGGLWSVNRLEVESRAWAIASFHPLVAPTFIQTGGGAVLGDLGDALYKKVLAEPGHAGKLSITLADGVTVVWYEIAEDFVRPEMFAGASDLERLQFALAMGAKHVQLVAGKTYTLSGLLTISTAVHLFLNDGSIEAASGFTDGNVIKLDSNDITIEGGTVDGVNLPAITADFAGADFKGITIYKAGTGVADSKTGIVLRNLKVKAGSCGGVTLYDTDGLVVENVSVDASAGHATFANAAAQFYHRCHNANYDRLKVIGAKWKAVSFSSSDNWIATHIKAFGSSLTSNAGNALVFTVNCSNWLILGIKTKGGFGFKADKGLAGALNGFNIDASGIADGGIMLQGCDRVHASRGTIRDVTAYGVIFNHHTSPLTSTIDCGASDITMFRTGASGDGSIGIRFDADTTTFGCYGIKCENIRIRGFAIAMQTSDVASAHYNDLYFTGIRCKDIKDYIFRGPVQKVAFDGVAVESSTGLTQVFMPWTRIAATSLTIKNCDVSGIGTAAFFVDLDTANGTIQYDQVDISGNTVKGGGRYIEWNINSSSMRVRAATINGNNFQGGASASGVRLNNLGTINTQIMAAGNMVLDADGVTKQAFAFTNTAASGKWNGLCAVTSNMATVTNVPNNV